MKSDFCGLYLVTDPVLKSPGLDVVELVDRACSAGVRIVQYRDKNCGRSEYIDTGAAIRDAAWRHGALFIVNDRVDTVSELRADGVHVGQDDQDARLIRRQFGTGPIVGVSVSSVKQAMAAQKNGATYVAVNGVFPTGTKHFPGNRSLGLEMVTAVCSAVTVPVIGIGGINESNAAEVMRAGAAGIAVVTAITNRSDIEAAVAGLLFEIKGFSV